MLFGSYQAFINIAIFILIFILTRRFIKNALVRNFSLTTANIIVLLTVVKEHTIIVLAILSLLVFLAGRVLQKKSMKSIFTSALTFIILLFAIRNYPSVQEVLSKSYLSILNEPILSIQKVGVSYILFRYVHWLIESYRKKIQSADYLTFVNYILFFPTFLAGPIDSYKNFHYWLRNTNFKYFKSLFFSGISRILLGAVKTLIIVPYLIEYATDYKILLDSFSPIIAISLSLLAYSAYIYIDFSGYSDIAIGTAYLMGIRTPENFNNPYLSKSLSEFWKKWHITFSTFLLAYVFKPFIALFNRIMPNNPRIVNSSLGYLSTFVICGIWHGTTINFVFWGLWHGIGLSINKIWTVYFKEKLVHQNTIIYNSTSVLITFLFVTIGWMFFHYSQSELVLIFNRF